MKKNTMQLIGAVVLVFVLIGAVIFVKNQGKPPENSQLTLTTQPASPQLGNNTLIITVRDTTGKLVDTAKVSIDVNMTTMNMGTQRGNATSQGGGQYSANARFSMRGPWRVAVTTQFPDGEKTSKNFHITIP